MFQASSHLLWLQSPVCFGSGRKPIDRVSHGTGHMTPLYSRSLQSIWYQHHSCQPPLLSLWLRFLYQRHNSPISADRKISKSHQGMCMHYQVEVGNSLDRATRDYNSIARANHSVNLFSCQLQLPFNINDNVRHKSL